MGLPEIRHRVAHLSTFWLVNILKKTKLTPNALTLIGLLGSFVAAALVAWEYFLLGGIIVLLAAAFDLFDGPLARITGRVSKFGALLDSVSDRLSEAAVLLGILIVYLQQDAFWEPVVVYLTLAGSVMVSYTRARAEGLGLKCEVGLFTRAERVIVLALGIMLAQWFAASLLITLSLLAGLSWMTTLQRMVYIMKPTD